MFRPLKWPSSRSTQNEVQFNFKIAIYQPKIPNFGKLGLSSKCKNGKDFEENKYNRQKI